MKAIHKDSPLTGKIMASRYLMRWPLFQNRTKINERVDFASTDISVTVIPGLGESAPTRYDKQILYYCLGLFRQKYDPIRPGDLSIRTTYYDIASFMCSSGRSPNGADYERIKASLQRLAAATIVATADVSDGMQLPNEQTFGFVSWYRHEAGCLEILLDATFREMVHRNSENLSLDHGFFLLTGPKQRAWEIVLSFQMADEPIVVELPLCHQLSGMYRDASTFKNNVFNNGHVRIGQWNLVPIEKREIDSLKRLPIEEQSLAMVKRNSLGRYDLTDFEEFTEKEGQIVKIA